MQIAPVIVQLGRGGGALFVRLQWSDVDVAGDRERLRIAIVPHFEFFRISHS